MACQIRRCSSTTLAPMNDALCTTAASCAGSSHPRWVRRSKGQRTDIAWRSPSQRVGLALQGGPTHVCNRLKASTDSLMVAGVSWAAAAAATAAPGGVTSHPMGEAAAPMAQHAAGYVAQAALGAAFTLMAAQRATEAAEAAASEGGALMRTVSNNGIAVQS
uniref:Uncharacterized protein n=1 Tax=Florenciella parvula TaxID=236787 RepID=A0A7S2BRQ8_9STRA